MNKLTIVITLGVFISSFLISCEKGFGDFLDKPPGVDVTEDTIFSTQKDIEAFLFGTYFYGIHSYLPYDDLNNKTNPNPTLSMTAYMSDEAEVSESWFNCQAWNTGAIVKNDIVFQEDSRFYLRWQAIRRCNILIERLPGTSLSQAQKDGYSGEAYFIRALNNFEMFKRYGAMPIVDRRLNVGENMAIPRPTLTEFVDYIIKDCDKATDLLKDVTYTSAQMGRATELVALTLKAKVLLFSASPLFNTANPVISGGNSKLICHGNYDKERWKLAADATLVAINKCAQYNVALINTGSPETDYLKSWETYDNSEIILAEKWSNTQGDWAKPWNVLVPKFASSNTWDEHICVTHNFIKKYEKMDGTPQKWNPAGVVGNDLQEKYAQLDPRFRQTVTYNLSKYTNNVPVTQLFKGGQQDSYKNLTGTLMRKLIPPTMTGWPPVVPNATLFRISELYLNYAEALNEYNNASPQDVYTYLNLLRARAGMPDIPSLNQDQMREKIKNERAIELAFEDHRMWDIRRWIDAEKDGVMQGDFYGLKINKISDEQYSYEIYKFETRTFHRRMYIHPIVESEVNKGYLEQNPGW